MSATNIHTAVQGAPALTLKDKREKTTARYPVRDIGCTSLASGSCVTQ
jgi:hypothetical protein